MPGAKILLTGATGFLGSHLLGMMLRGGHQAVVLKRRSSDLSRVRDRLGTRLEGLPMVELETVDLRALFSEERFDAVVHCATHYGRGDQDPSEVVEANLLLPLRLLQLAAKHRVGLFVNTDTVLDKRVSHYSLSKKQFLDWFRLYSVELACVNVALEHFYGAGDNRSKFVSMIIKELIDEAPDIKLTPGRQKRDFIHIDDVVEAFAAILRHSQKSPPGFQHYEVGTESPVEIREFVTLAKELAGNSRTRLEFGAIPYRDGEVMESRVDLRPIRALGWAPRITLADGLARTILAEKAGSGCAR